MTADGTVSSMGRGRSSGSRAGRVLRLRRAMKNRVIVSLIMLSERRSGGKQYRCQQKVE